MLHYGIPGVLAIVGLVFSAGTLSAQEVDTSAEIATDEVEETEEIASEEEAKSESEDGDADSESEEVASDVESDDETAELAEETVADDEPMEVVEVTGTRLPVADPTALVHSYTAEQISLTGASTLDDFFRTVPWQFNSTNPQTSTIFGTGDDLTGDSGSIWNAYDLASINLQGLGSSNTLVLLNGRRVAGYGGSERDIVNILGIPMQAIERIDIQLDGGSAVYGSDAISGVVNFITKKNYRGMTVDVKDERSGTGSDLFTGGLTFGLTWGRGNGTFTLSQEEQEPILNAKTRFTTRDYRDSVGVEFDYRNYSIGQPGIVRHWNCSNAFPGPYFNNLYCDGTWTQDEEKLVSFQLPPDHSGLNAKISDFASGPAGGFWTHPEHINPYDRIPRENGAHTGKDGATMNLQHEVFQGFKVFLDGLYSKSYSRQASQFPVISVTVPASNAFNPWDVPMHVTYAPGLEQDNGLLPTPYSDTVTENNTATVGFEWSFRPQQTMEVSITESRTQTTKQFFSFQFRKDRYADGTEEFYRRLSSPDPEEAFNFFGNGTVQPDAFGNFLGRSRTDIGTNTTTSYQVNVKGHLFEFRGDEISYVIGTSRRVRKYENRHSFTFGWLNYDFDQNSVWNGSTEPALRNESYFGEVWIPLVTEQHNAWWGESLHLTLKNIRTIDSSWGADGGGINVDFEVETELEVWDVETGEWIQEGIGYNLGYSANDDLPMRQYKEGDNVPNVGVVYYPRSDMRITVNYSRTIQQPLLSELFDTLQDSEWQVYDILDLYDPDGPTMHDVVPYRYSWGNADLEAAVGESHSLRVKWWPQFLSGLEMEVSYISTSFQGQIEHTSAYFREPLALRSPDLANRNERGDLQSLTFDYFNAHVRQSTTADAHVSYRFGTPGLGTLETRVHYHRKLEDYNEPFEGIVLSSLGTALSPDRYRTTLQMFWDRDKMSASMMARYTPGYLNEFAHYCSIGQKLNQVGRCADFALFNFNSWLSLDVPSLTVVDATFKYRFSTNFEVQFSGLNVFDRFAPLTVRSGLPYDPTRWNGRGRIISASVRYMMHQE